MNILIIGGGIYVRGDGYKNFGTILPAVLQAQKSKLVDKIFVSTDCLSSPVDTCFEVQLVNGIYQQVKFFQA